MTGTASRPHPKRQPDERLPLKIVRFKKGGRAVVASAPYELGPGDRKIEVIYGPEFRPNGELLIWRARLWQRWLARIEMKLRP